MPPTCGYVCPRCGGAGYDEEGAVCDWCAPSFLGTPPTQENTNQVIPKKEVLHLENHNIEVPLLKDSVPFLSRFDFKAIIETETGQ